MAHFTIATQLVDKTHNQHGLRREEIADCERVFFICRICDSRQYETSFRANGCVVDHHQCTHCSVHFAQPLGFSKARGWQSETLACPLCSHKQLISTANIHTSEQADDLFLPGTPYYWCMGCLRMIPLAINEASAPDPLALVAATKGKA